MEARPLYTQEELQQAIEERTQTEINVLVRELQYMAEEVVTEARTGVKKMGKDYKTQTGNLRSSIGYVIALNGQVVTESEFTPIRGTESGEKGRDTGREFAREIASTLPNLSVVIVAGMNYATYLHGRGYDVLDTAELVAKDLLQELLNDFN